LFNFWFPGDGLGRQVADIFSLHRLVAPVAASSTGYLRDEYEKSQADERGGKIDSLTVLPPRRRRDAVGPN